VTAAIVRSLADEARTDRPLVARGLTDAGSMRDTIWPAFRDEVAPWATLDYEQDVVAGRLLASVRGKAEEDRPAVALVSNPALFDRAGVLAPFEAAFADRFPAGWVDPAGRWLPVYVQPIVAIHNAHRASPPRSWDDFVGTAVRDRLVFDEPARMLTTGPALAELSSVLGASGWETFMRALAARAPRLVGDNERAVLEVATGTSWTGLSNWNVARRVRPGSPVRHTFLAPTPCVPGFGVLVRGAASEPLGRAFLAWLSSEAGQQAYARTGRIPARPDVRASPSLASLLPAGVEPLFGSADWLTDPERWVARFEALIPRTGDTALEGKLR
jgi:ABC-type Fe3+ transport system substrate-binding protein